MNMQSKIKRLISTISVSVFTLASVLTFSIAKPMNAYAKENQKASQNNYPIILCHGCNGWGRTENFGTVAFGARYYWGGNVDLQQKLIENGFKTYTAAVGPL